MRLNFSAQGFQWVQADAAADNVFIFVRRGHNASHEIVCVANLSPLVRQWRVGVPAGGGLRASRSPWAPGAGRLFLFHHDPGHVDTQVEDMAEEAG